VRNPGSPRKAAALTLIALFLLSCVPRTHAHRASHHKSRNDLFNTSLAAWDVDGDIRQDRVTLQSNGHDKTIRILFGNTRRSQIAFTAPSDDSGRLVAGDIDRDGDVDLVWVGATDRKEAVVLLNDGDGNFAEITDNSQFASELDDLFSGGDPSGNRSLKRRQKTLVLPSASFHDVGLPLLVRFENTSVNPAPAFVPKPLSVQSPVVNHLCKRGPPPSLS